MTDRSLARITIALAVLASAASAMLPAGAQTGSFYEGKTIVLITSTGVGGTYDAMARAISRHMPRYIPGRPAMIVQNMPGAGNVLATNYMYNIAPKDGTALAVVHAAMPLHQVLDGRGVRYNAGKFNWLGSPGSENEVILVRKGAGIRTIEDARAKPVILGGTGEGSGLFIIPAAMNNVLGTRFKLVIGYKTSEEVNLAMERGEVQARAFGYDAIVAQHPDWIRDKTIDIIAQAGVRRNKDLPDVPLLTELARTDADREIMALVSSPAALGQPYLAPPGIPADRLAVLRQAFAATMKDKDFLADAAKLNLGVDPMGADEVRAIVEQTISAPPDIVAKAKVAIETTDGSSK
jgi:tripartite-type tricarboxylate transporter receptor subunit TctC